MFEWFLIYVLPFVLILTGLVFIHELGHYSVARYYGVKIEMFSIGFGPEIFGRTDKHGTRWKVCLLPLGGYVKMQGDGAIAESSSELSIHTPDDRVQRKAQEGSFCYKTVGKRIAIAGAGPAANYILAFFLFVCVYSIFGQMYQVPRISEVIPNSAAFEAGLKVGDLVTKIQGTSIDSFSQISKILDLKTNQDPSQPLVVEVLRENEKLVFEVRPKHIFFPQESREREQGFFGLGIKSISFAHKTLGIPELVYASMRQIFFISWKNLYGLIDMVRGGHTMGLSGPLRIAQFSGEMAKLGAEQLLLFSALLSVSLGFINLLPIPNLDGGRLFFYFIEWIRGKPVSLKVQEWAFLLGLFVLMSLFVFTTWNDLKNLNFLSWLSRVFCMFSGS